MRDVRSWRSALVTACCEIDNEFDNKKGEGSESLDAFKHSLLGTLA